MAERWGLAVAPFHFKLYFSLFQLGQPFSPNIMFHVPRLHCFIGIIMQGKCRFADCLPLTGFKERFIPRRGVPAVDSKANKWRQVVQY